MKTNEPSMKHGAWIVSHDLKVRTGDAVLVKAEDRERWKRATFSHTESGDYAPFCTDDGDYWRYCIPYIGNEYLEGTNDEWAEFIEPTKIGFRFGAKVRYRDGNEMREGRLLGFNVRRHAWAVAHWDHEEEDFYLMVVKQIAYID